MTGVEEVGSIKFVFAVCLRKAEGIKKSTDVIDRQRWFPLFHNYFIPTG
jgi:hypothetical protein